MIVLVLLGVLFLSLVVAVDIGYLNIPVKDIISVILYRLGLAELPAHIDSSVVDIVILIRMPRLILAAIVGMSLAVAGTVMQAIVRNPLADPYILGISSGASFGASLAIVTGFGTFFGAQFVGVTASVTAFLVSLVVVLVANIGGRANSTRLLLAGMALSTVCSSFSSLLIYFSNSRETSRLVSFWLMGSVAGANWEQIVVVGPLILLGTLFFMTQFRPLNLMLLGDEVAITLGLDLHRYRQLYLLVASVMVGFVVYVSGVLGFVGLIVPHVARLVFGTDHRRLLPVAGLLGALLLLWADVLSRVLVKGTQIPVGIIISVLGAPLFIYLIISRSKAALR